MERLWGLVAWFAACKVRLTIHEMMDSLTGIATDTTAGAADIRSLTGSIIDYRDPRHPRSGPFSDNFTAPEALQQCHGRPTGKLLYMGDIENIH